MHQILIAALLVVPLTALTEIASNDSDILMASPEPLDEEQIQGDYVASAIETEAFEVWFDPEVLRRFPIAPHAKELSRIQTEKNIVFKPNVLWVELPEFSDPIRLEFREVHQHSLDVVTYFGNADGEDAYAATITVNHLTNQVLARIHHQSELYLIDGEVVDNRVQLHVIDKTRMPSFDCAARDAEPMSPRTRDSFSSADNNTMLTSQENGNVRVLFYYTPEVASANNIDLMIDNIVVEMNATTNSSGIDPKNYINAAGKIQTTQNFNFSSECGCCSTIDLLKKMRDKEGEFSQISSQMDAVYADISVLLVSTSLGLGCVRFGGAILPDHDMNDPVPYALITDEFALADLTALHEIGHLLGSGHEVSAAQTPDPIEGAPSNARGFLEPQPFPSGALWQTMMGGYQTKDVCEFSGHDPENQSCVRLPIWSNPDRLYGGKPTGDVTTAFNAQAFNSTMPSAAEWGSGYPHPVPSAPILMGSPVIVTDLMA